MKQLFLYLLLTLTAAAETRWQPGRTYVLVASITSWPKAAGLDSFTGTRRDGDLVKQFQAAGVPQANMVFLKDSQASRAGIRKALTDLARRTTPADTLIFYFQGHGGRKLLYAYDYAGGKTALDMGELYPLLKPNLQANRLMLIGDCCCSGSLDSVRQQFAQGSPNKRVAVLASATATNLSTGNWTYTEGLIRLLAGDPLVDGNRNGVIDMGEADDFLHRQMKYRENQLPSVQSNFESDFVWRDTQGRAAARVPGAFGAGDLLEAQDSQGTWYTAEILDVKDNRYKTHFNGWDSKWDEWLDVKRLRPIRKPKLQLHQPYEVVWQQQWYPATLTQSVEDYFYFAHFENEAGEDDEWITADRARVPRGKLAGPDFRAAGAVSPPAVGDRVAAQSRQIWCHAQVTSQANGIFAVRYDDGTTGQVSLSGLIPLSPAAQVGSRVLACWDNTGQMYPGHVLRVQGQRVVVRWEDGSAPSEVPGDRVAVIRP